MVHLDYLESLVVGGPFHETVTLISCLTLPPRCSFDLFLWSAAVPRSDKRTLATFLERNLSSWETYSPFRALVAHYSVGFISLTNKYITSNEEDLLTRRCVRPAKDDPFFKITLSPRTSQDSMSLFLSFRVFSPTFPTTKNPRFKRQT